jgi:hypothetical protein
MTNPMKATVCGDYLYWPSINELEDVIIKYLSAQTGEITKSKRSNRKTGSKTVPKGYRRKVALKYLENYPGKRNSEIRELIKEKEGVEISNETISRAKRELRRSTGSGNNETD